MGCVSTIDSNGRTIWIVDAHREDGKRFVARADEKLTAFLELEAAIRAVAYHLFSASSFNTSQATTAKLVPPPPQPTRRWPPSAMAYSVSSSPSGECFRTVARTAWFLCMLSTYTSVKPEFLPQLLDATRIRAQLERPPEPASSRRCFSIALWQPVRTARAAAANKMVLTPRRFCDRWQP